MRRYWTVGTLAAIALVGGIYILFFAPPGPQAVGIFAENPGALPADPLPETVAEEPPAQLAPPRTSPAGHREYRNERYRFSLFYPSNMKVAEFDEGGGTRTITFENAAEGRGFQIFIVPYNAPQVSLDRFKKDSPLGVMDKPVDVTVDGAVGTMFYSKTALLGDTREIWFLKNRYLFEINAPKVLDEWLVGIIQTWKFI